MLNNRITNWLISLGLTLLWVGSVGAGNEGMAWVAGVLTAGLIIELAVVGIRSNRQPKKS